MSDQVRYQAVTVEGGIVPPGLLARVQAGEVTDQASLDPRSYRLPRTYSVQDAANGSWTKVRAAWRQWREDAATAPTGRSSAAATRRSWLEPLLYELGWGELSQARTQDGRRGIEVGGQLYPVSHLVDGVVVHLLGQDADLDRRRPGVEGAERAPQAMVQELLNRSPEHLWALLSDGGRLRLLRDSTALVGTSYIEFDLDAIVDGELFAEFLLLWQLCHRSRFARRDGGAPCWLEVWRTEAVEAGTRALGRLRDGVRSALEQLGSGFLRHPDNGWLRRALHGGELTVEQYHGALLRLVYRLLFCFVTEDQPDARRVLPDPQAEPSARNRYRAYFATARLRAMSRRLTGGPHADLWHAQRLVLVALGREDGEPRIAVPALGGLFEPDDALPLPEDAPHPDLLLGAEIANRDLLAAVRSLAWLSVPGQRLQPVDYRNLGAIELGSVYESLLEYVPRLDLTERTFGLTQLAGNDRKKSGSYYTPSPLIDLVLDTALDPLLDRAVKDAQDPADAEHRLLALTVCDPACGSGHFLVAAARRLATRLASVRCGDMDPAPEDVQEAMHDVVSTCIYGVDLNPMALELAKVSLWLEAARPGRPLSFLDAHLRHGNALLGATPTLIAGGIPDGAYKPLAGDDRSVATELRKINASQRTAARRLASGQFALDFGGLHVGTVALGRRIGQVTALRPKTLREVHDQRRRLRAIAADPEFAARRRVADAWCAAFVQRRDATAATGTGLTADALQRLERPESADSPLAHEVAGLAQHYHFFHWHLEFPEIFTVPEDLDPASPTGWTGGFGGVIGNPPWERVKLQEKEFFATRDPDIAAASNAARRKAMIEALDSAPDRASRLLGQSWHDAQRDSQAQTHLLRQSGRYPLTGAGDVNTYSVFAETMRAITRPDGRFGVITPTGLATDATTAPFFADMVKSRTLAAVYDFVTNPRIWTDVGNRRFRFAITSGSGGQEIDHTTLAFLNRHPDELVNPGRRYTLRPADLARLNPNTGTCPVFETEVDAELVRGIYQRLPVLKLLDGTNPWGLRFLRMFDMSNDSTLFRAADELSDRGAAFDGWAYRYGERVWLPLYEGKMVWHYDHRLSTYSGRPEGSQDTELPRVNDHEHDDPAVESLARWWVTAKDVDEALLDQRHPQKPPLWERDWLLGWRDIARATDARTFVPAVLPRSAVGHKFPLATLADPDHGVLLHAVWSSLVLDYVARQKLSGSGMSYFIVYQLACPVPAVFARPAAWTGHDALAEWVRPRVLELAYTSYRLAPYARDNGDDGPPFRWSPQRRQLLRAELDAAMFHVYGLARSEVEHVLDSFLVVRKNEEHDLGEYRTRRLVLERYDAMAAAAEYVSPLDPAPGHGPRHPWPASDTRYGPSA